MVEMEAWFPLASLDDADAEAAQRERLLAAAGAAAGRGGSRVWVGSPGSRRAAGDTLHLAVAVALHCPALRVVATGIDSGRDPRWIRLAEDVATADGLCGGRLELAFARLPGATLLARLRDAWSGVSVPVAVGGGDAEVVEVYPRPARPDGPQLWVEAPDPEVAARAAALELGAVVADVASARAHRAAARAAGLVPPLAILASGIGDGQALPYDSVRMERIAID